MKLKHISLIDLVLCIVLSVAFAVAPYYVSEGKCNFSLELVLTVIVVLVVLVSATFFIRRTLESPELFIDEKMRSGTGAVGRCCEKLMQHPKHLLIIAGLVFLSWLPALIFLYPGTCINDTWGQLCQYIGFTSGAAALSDHHPVFDAFLMGSIIVNIPASVSRESGIWKP